MVWYTERALTTSKSFVVELEIDFLFGSPFPVVVGIWFLPLSRDQLKSFRIPFVAVNEEESSKKGTYSKYW